MRWTDDEGAEGVLHGGHLSVYAKPSMTREDGVVAVGIDAEWIVRLRDLVREANAMLGLDVDPDSEWGLWRRRVADALNQSEA